ncbi:hypothetical protein SLA2020_150600 [Shorea laevis]
MGKRNWAQEKPRFSPLTGSLETLDWTAPAPSPLNSLDRTEEWGPLLLSSLFIGIISDESWKWPCSLKEIVGAI